MERHTIQRTVILEAIEEMEHSTIPDILNRCKEDFPSISVGTIYRNLLILEEEGLIRRIPTKYKEDVYESCSKNSHDHFICKECHSIIDLKLDKKFQPFTNEYGDLVDEECIVYYGICKECLEKDKC